MLNVFKFDPEASDAPLTNGRYDAEVTHAEARVSRAGNPMLDMTLRMLDQKGNDVYVKDYLVCTPRGKWKIKQFCQALDLDFSKGEIDLEGVLGRHVLVEIGVEEDDRGRDRNVVTGYVLPEGAAVANDREESHNKTGGRMKGRLELEDDEIPF